MISESFSFLSDLSTSSYTVFDSCYANIFLTFNVSLHALIFPYGPDSNVSNINLDLDSMLSHPPLLFKPNTSNLILAQQFD